MMRNRWKISLKVAAAAALASTAIAVPVFGQTPQYYAPQYYAPKISPTPTGTLPAASIQPGAGVQTLPPVTNKPRLTQPVIAGADGVRPVSANDFDLNKSELPKLPSISGTATPPAFFPPPPSSPTTLPVPNLTMPEPKLPQPTVTAEKPTISAPMLVPTTPAPLPTTPTLPSNSGLAPAPLVVPNTPSSFTPGTPPLTGSFNARSTPNVSVEFEAPESVGVGQTLTYSLVVKNSGTTGVSNVRVEDEVPTGASFVSSEPASESNTEGKLGWSFSALEAGVEKRIKITVKVAEEGEVRSRATVGFSVGVEAKVKVTRPKMVLALTGPDSARTGEKVPFTIKISNAGTGPAAKVVLQARFSGGLQHPQGEVIEAEISNLAAGANKSLTLEALANKSGQQLCSLTVWADGNAPETVKVNLSVVEPMLVAKQAGPARCLVKAEPVYAIELTNPGTAGTDPITTWTVVPEGFEFVAASEGGFFSATNKTVQWKLPGLPANGTKTLTVKLRAIAPTDGIVRTLAVTGNPESSTPGIAQVGAKSKSLEAKAESPVKAEGVPALRFEVAGSEGVVEVGKEVTYEVKVSNPGTGACTNVQLVVELADSTTATDAKGPTVGRTTGQQILFDPIATVGVKGEATYRVKVKGTQAGDMRFRVKMTCDQNRNPVVKEENTRFYKE